MSVVILLVELAILAIGVAILTILYVTRNPPYHRNFQFRDPRTGDITTEFQWLTPVFDYSPYNRDVPDPKISSLYCQYDSSKCIASFSQFQSATQNQDITTC
jgi:hypothetical protein